MEFEQIPTILTAEELLDRSFRRAASVRREKTNKNRANEEFVRAVASSLYDKLHDSVKKFPSFDSLPPFYQDMVEILFGIGRVKRSLGALAWAGDQVRTIGSLYAREMRRSKETSQLRRKAVARISSVVHQVEGDLLFLNEVRNVLRKLPEIGDEFTVVVAGYPNVGKSSLIRLISTAEPEIASYAFTTKAVIVGHRQVGRDRMQLVDTPGILDRPREMRNAIEQQALSAVTHIADVILFLLDASEQCGYPLDAQVRLLEEVQSTARVPVEVVVNKSDIRALSGYPNISTETGEGVAELIDRLLRYRESSPRPPQLHTQ
jgi:nucleolar GTP-binding protein